MCLRGFDWYQNRSTWITLNNIIALILRYFTEFSSFWSRLRLSGWRYLQCLRLKCSPKNLVSSHCHLWWYSRMLLTASALMTGTCNNRSSKRTATYIHQSWHTLQHGLSATAELLVHFTVRVTSFTSPSSSVVASCFKRKPHHTAIWSRVTSSRKMISPCDEFSVSLSRRSEK